MPPCTWTRMMRAPIILASALCISPTYCTTPTACFSSTCEQEKLDGACGDSECGTSQLQLISAMSRFDFGGNLGLDSNDTASDSATWDIFDPKGIKYTDVAQGELG